ncbi:hypothetical protein PR048_025906 [Dryococelus australis]|uniref:Uncharacterized protein n=1 Tax=Dryococelus australis TaxID=614101 RepID=A0ABQ9GJV4_9NEOP|nr:hypothetical protein PR048_025906 [Dryococelus australis]
MLPQPFLRSHRRQNLFDSSHTREWECAESENVPLQAMKIQLREVNNILLKATKLIIPKMLQNRVLNLAHAKEKLKKEFISKIARKINVRIYEEELKTDMWQLEIWFR